jgi:hypothetical protein
MPPEEPSERAECVRWTTRPSACARRFPTAVPTSPIRIGRGFRFLDTKDSAKLAADASYREMVARLDYRHRQQDGASDHGSQRTLDADALERAAADAYEARSERMRTAWKNHA